MSDLLVALLGIHFYVSFSLYYVVIFETIITITKIIIEPDELLSVALFVSLFNFYITKKGSLYVKYYFKEL